MHSRNMRPLLATFLAIFGVLGAISAAPASGQASGPMLRITYRAGFTGKLDASGTFEQRVHRGPKASDDAYKDCRDYLVRRLLSDGQLDVPGEVGVSVGGHKFGLHVSAPGATVPGTYDTGPESEISVSFSDMDEETYSFSKGEHGGRASIALKADGSGEVSVFDLSNSSGDKESGTVTWTCR